MNIYHSIDEFAASGIAATTLTTGTFDGVHLGHKKLLDRVRAISSASNSQSALLTFQPHPREILNPGLPGFHLLSTPDEKRELLEKAGIENLIIHPFSMEFSKIPALDFVTEILLKKLHLKTLAIGHDHRFGKNREGSIADLIQWSGQYGFNVEEISPFLIENIVISSSKIRKLLQEGDSVMANKYLGYPYSISSKVIKGMGMGGKLLGFPTANLEPEEKDKIIPGDGIYAVYVELTANSYKLMANSYKGMMSIGNNPTFQGKGRSMEVNIFDFTEDIYGKRLRVFFIKKLRNEVTFASADALIKQMKQDKTDTLSVLSQSPIWG